MPPIQQRIALVDQRREFLLRDCGPQWSSRALGQTKSAARQQATRSSVGFAQPGVTRQFVKVPGSDAADENSNDDHLSCRGGRPAEAQHPG